jgi:hypothetical protein
MSTSRPAPPSHARRSTTSLHCTPSRMTCAAALPTSDDASAKKSRAAARRIAAVARFDRAQAVAALRLAIGMRYALARWMALTRYVDDGRLEIDNNAAERSLRGVALGRKNWLFAGSDQGGQGTRRACGRMLDTFVDRPRREPVGRTPPITASVVSCAHRGVQSACADRRAARLIMTRPGQGFGRQAGPCPPEESARSISSRSREHPELHSSPARTTRSA